MRSLKHALLAVLALTVVLGLAGAAPSLAMSRETARQLMKVSVQLGPVFEVDTEEGTVLRSRGWGSGTIVSADGLILTNNHVVDTSDLAEQLPENARVVEGVLCVFVTGAPDEPPVPTYLADVVVADPDVDLAVLRISSTTSGKTLRPKDLKLPYCQLGDSDTLQPLDPIYIIGYPGIGGETVTTVTGVVSGFTAEGAYGNRAWIKTDATISGGNSGGTAVDDDGLLIGVPTQAGRGGVGAEDEYVDCRPLADTNGDGQIDGNDTCVPVGGFINALRPVNLAVPLIEEAQGSQPPVNPKTPTTPPSSKTPTPKPRTQPTPTPEPPTPEPGDGVYVMGTILDADTDEPIPGALFLALNPGVTYDDFESDDQVYSAAEADEEGFFMLPDALIRGETYTLVSGLKDYYPVYEDNVYVGEDADPIVDLTITLKRR